MGLPLPGAAALEPPVVPPDRPLGHHCGYLSDCRLPERLHDLLAGRHHGRDHQQRRPGHRAWG
jgi:hypothetical protein